MSRKSRWGLLLLAAVGSAAGLLILGCAVRGERASRRPNILLITLCSFRFDRLGAAGYWRPLTPYLDSLARRGVFFDNVVSASSWTKPAAASILTGLTPGVHQLDDYYEVDDIVAGRIKPKRTMPPGAITLAELLRGRGYRTASRVNNVHAGEYFGVTRGFEDRRTDNTVRTETLLDGFERWLDNGDQRPFFFWLLTLDAHTPYAPGLEYYRRTARRQVPENDWEYEKLRVRVYGEVMSRLNGSKDWPEKMRRDWVDLYDAGVLRLDEKLSRITEILRRRGLSSSTVILVTADHGERFFEHGRVDHGWFPDQPTLKVPLIVVGPSISQGVRVARVVRSIDLYPTIAELAGAKPPPFVRGASLAPWLHGTRPEGPQRPAVAYADGEYALRLGRYNLRYAPAGGLLGLFDVRADFLEKQNLAAEYPDRVKRMAMQLRRQLELDGADRRVIGPAGQRTLSPEVLDQLRSLGYLGRSPS